MKAFELAERLGGMTAFELMGRMTDRELSLWVAYDNVNISKQDYQYANVMARLELINGAKKASIKKYLPKVRRRRRTLEEIKLNFNAAVANSGGSFHGGRKPDDQ